MFSPAEHDQSGGFDWTGHSGNLPAAEAAGFSLRDALRADLDWICRHAEALVGLPGWKDSAGSLAEIHTAWALGIPVHELGEFLEKGTRAAQITRGYPLALTVRRTSSDPDKS